MPDLPLLKLIQKLTSLHCDLQFLKLIQKLISLHWSFTNAGTVAFLLQQSVDKLSVVRFEQGSSAAAWQHTVQHDQSVAVSSGGLVPHLTVANNGAAVHISYHGSNEEPVLSVLDSQSLQV